MDKDIRAALFDGFDEDGEFEELQDDFITQVRSACSSLHNFTVPCCAFGRANVPKYYLLTHLL